MKKILTALLLMTAVTMLLVACKKDYYGDKAVVNTSTVGVGLNLSANTLVLDSSKNSTTAITFTWPTVNYGFAADVNFSLQFDVAKDSFKTPITMAVGVNLYTYALTVQALEAITQQLNLPAAKADTMVVRLAANVNANGNVNNGSASTIPTQYSNTQTIFVTPYATKPIPLYTPPTSLYIVGDATAGGWNNPVPTPLQQLTQIDQYGNVFAAVLQLIGGKQYVFLPKNGDWTVKYTVPSSTANPAGDAFKPNAGNDNIPAPAASGLYKIVVDFIKGTYTVTAVTTNPIPANLYIVGDATPGAWANPVPVPSQQFTQVSNGDFQITVSLASTGSYLFLPLNGDWTNKYGGASATGGALLYNGAVPNSNTPAPSANGNYLIDVNILANTYQVTKK